MKKKVILFVMVVLLAITVPAYAASKEPGGDRIDVRTQTPTTFTSGEPFHVSHGWGGMALRDIQPGQTDFRLWVDGEFVDQDFVYRDVSTEGDEPILTLVWVHNFPEGLGDGDHTFEGRWYLPCSAALEGGWIAGPCEKPNKPAEVHYSSLVVTFSP